MIGSCFVCIKRDVSAVIFAFCCSAFTCRGSRGHEHPLFLTNQQTTHKLGHSFTIPFYAPHTPKHSGASTYNIHRLSLLEKCSERGRLSRYHSSQNVCQLKSNGFNPVLIIISIKTFLPCFTLSKERYS